MSKQFSRNHPVFALTLIVLSGCQGGDETSTPPPEIVPISWALAIDPGAPFEPVLLEEAAQDGLARWEVGPSPLRFFFQGSGDVPNIGNDGLQVIHIWWHSTEDWPEDESSLVQQWTYLNTAGGVQGFDLTIKGPDCLGQDEGGGKELAKIALANTLASAVGVAYNVLDPDGLGSHLTQAACETAGPLYPTDAELSALSGKGSPSGNDGENIGF